MGADQSMMQQMMGGQQRQSQQEAYLTKLGVVKLYKGFVSTDELSLQYQLRDKNETVDTATMSDAQRALFARFKWCADDTCWMHERDWNNSGKFFKICTSIAKASDRNKFTAIDCYVRCGYNTMNAIKLCKLTPKLEEGEYPFGIAPPQTQEEEQAFDIWVIMMERLDGVDVPQFTLDAIQPIEDDQQDDIPALIDTDSD